MHNVVFTEKSLKDFGKIDLENQNRIILKLKEYSIEPLKYCRKLSNPKIGTYRFRIGDYRVIFDLDEDLIVILRIGHRKNIYD